MHLQTSFIDSSHVDPRETAIDETALILHLSNITTSMQIYSEGNYQHGGTVKYLNSICEFVFLSRTLSQLTSKMCGRGTDSVLIKTDVDDKFWYLFCFTSDLHVAKVKTANENKSCESGRSGWEGVGEVLRGCNLIRKQDFMTIREKWPDIARPFCHPLV